MENTLGANKRTPATLLMVLIAIGFGLLTVKQGGSVPFGQDEAMRAAGS